MIGLYLLTTRQLEKDKTIKFGMSMRIEYRWIDYLIIFNDSKYIYYYEILDDLSRNQIVDIETEIIEIYKDNRNYYYQTEYFYCDNYELFHQIIINTLNNKKVNYKVHNVHNFNRKYYDNKPEPFDSPIINNKIDQSSVFIPYDYQIETINKIDDYYKDNNICKIIWSCGLGKTLLSILVVQKLNFKSVLIGVPSIYLQKQMKHEILKIFNNPDNILYVGGENENCESYIIKSTTCIEDIDKFINSNSNDCKFIITTYSSCYLLSNNYLFDFKIGDEAHHLVGSQEEKTKDAFHKIKSNKTLFMTATEKVIENNNNNKIIYSMDDINIFGECIDTKSICWAIENKKITDYNLIILKNTEDEVNNIISSLNLNNENINKDLFLSAFMALKSIEKYDDLTHILIYTNKTENAELVKKYIDIILNLNIININKDNYYNKALHSNSKENLNDIKLPNGFKEGEITKFKKSNWGIISSVYIFGEGFDCPRLNGVVFSENMESDIRIVQATLRPNRIDKNFPNKKAYVIIPYIDTDNFITDNESFDKCRKIISKIRNVDERLEYKINVVSLNYNLIDGLNINNNIKYCDIINNGDELTKIILRLRYSKSLESNCSEELDEYNYIRQLNKELNFSSKEEYVASKLIHQNYIDNPDKYFILKGVWKNWYHFLYIDTSIFIQNKNEWVQFCEDNNVSSINDYNELCNKYIQLPRNPKEFYNNFTNILNELKIKESRR